MFQVALDGSLTRAALGSYHLLFLRRKIPFVAHPFSLEESYVLNNENINSSQILPRDIMVLEKKL